MDLLGKMLFMEKSSQFLTSSLHEVKLILNGSLAHGPIDDLS